MKTTTIFLSSALAFSSTLAITFNDIKLNYYLVPAQYESGVVIKNLDISQEPFVTLDGQPLPIVCEYPEWLTAEPYNCAWNAFRAEKTCLWSCFGKDTIYMSPPNNGLMERFSPYAMFTSQPWSPMKTKTSHGKCLVRQILTKLAPSTTIG
jgi:hypothetical protein